MTKDRSPCANQHAGGHEPGAAEAADQLVELAKLLPLDDGGLQTAAVLSQALIRDRQHHEAQILRERLHQMCVPRWHFPMLRDAGRNAAYAKAIAAKVKPGDIVLDIGCGAGLTAMLAARAGAKHVYSCEQQPLIAKAAERVIAQNGLSDRITVIPKLSHDLVVGVDLPDRADVVISEIVDTVLLGEGALASLDHAMRELAKPGARAIPETGTLQAQLVTSPNLWELWRGETAEGFDLSAFNDFARVAQITPNDLAALNVRQAGPTEDLFTFDFANPTVQPARKLVELTCATASTLHAVLVSFRMVLSAGVELTNGLSSDGHWGRTAFLLDRSFDAMPGHSFRISAQHDTCELSVAMLGPVPGKNILRSGARGQAYLGNLALKSDVA